MTAPLDMPAIIQDLATMRDRLAAIELAIEASGLLTYEAGELAAHITTAIDSVSAAKSCAGLVRLSDTIQNLTTKETR